MFRLVKNIIVQLRNGSNRISYSSDIATDVVMGKKNHINASRIYGSAIQNHCKIDKSAIFSSSLGDHVKINNSNLFSANLSSNVTVDANSTIAGSSVNQYTYFAGNNLVFNSTIGSYCSIAGNVNIGHAEHPYQHFSTSPLFYKRDNPFGVTQFVDTEINEFSNTTIGNDVWIGLNAYIKSGIKVGDGSIIGAGSIVTKDVPPYGIVAGVPAKLIKMRFNEETIVRLKKDAWWNLSASDLLEYKKRNGKL